MIWQGLLLLFGCPLMSFLFLERCHGEKCFSINGCFYYRQRRSPDKDFSNRSKLGAQYPQLDIRGDHFVPGCAFRGPDTICQ